MIKNIAYAGIVMLAGMTMAAQDLCKASSEINVEDDCRLLIAGYRDAGRSREDFASVEDVKAYLKKNPTITGLALVHHAYFPDQFPLDFLNDYPNVKTLILRGRTGNPATFNLDRLQHITSFESGLYNDYLLIRFNFNIPGLVELGIPLRYFQTMAQGDMSELRTLTLSPTRWLQDSCYSISGIQKFNLRTLKIKTSQVTNTIELGLLSSLERLEIECLGWGKEEFKFLQNLRGLKSLKVNYGSNMNLDVLEGLSLLESFEISCLEAVKRPGYLEPLATLPSLKRLRLNSNGNLSDISVLSRCIGLVDLDFFHSQVSSIEALRDLPLIRLIMSGSKVTDLSVLKDVPTLRLLDISNTPQRIWQDWEGLRNHPSLQRIKAGDDDLSMETYIGRVARAAKGDQQDYVHTPRFYPLEVFKTVPNLELVCAQPTQVPKAILEAFKQARPNVAFADYGGWETRNLSEIEN